MNVLSGRSTKTPLAFSSHVKRIQNLAMQMINSLYHTDTQPHFLCRTSHFGSLRPRRRHHCTMVPLQHQCPPLLLHFPIDKMPSLDKSAQNSHKIHANFKSLSIYPPVNCHRHHHYPNCHRLHHCHLHLMCRQCHRPVLRLVFHYWLIPHLYAAEVPRLQLPVVESWLIEWLESPLKHCVVCFLVKLKQALEFPAHAVQGLVNWAMQANCGPKHRRV